MRAFQAITAMTSAACSRRGGRGAARAELEAPPPARLSSRACFGVEHPERALAVACDNAERGVESSAPHGDVGGLEERGEAGLRELHAEGEVERGSKAAPTSASSTSPRRHAAAKVEVRRPGDQGPENYDPTQRPVAALARARP